MYAGQVMDERDADALFAAPQHPYAGALLAAMPERHEGGDRLATIPGVVPGLHDRPAGCLFAPRCTYATPGVQRAARVASMARWARPLPLSAGRPRARGEPGPRSGAGDGVDMKTVVTAKNLRRTYEIRRGVLRPPSHLQAVGGISFVIEAGRTLAVVGESGCGKSTLARVVALIERPSDGALELGGADAVHIKPTQQRKLRKTVQMVFQNPLRLAQSAQENRRHPRGAADHQHQARARGACRTRARHAR
jgi:oligopeptide/dipeptide ABC transporter ATP-binding protein